MVGHRCLTTRGANVQKPILFNRLLGRVEADAGRLLGLVRAVTGNIAACMGLHAAWVAVILVVRTTSAPNPQSPMAWMMDDHDGFIGWMVLAWTPLMAWALHRWYQKKGDRSIFRSEK